MPTEISVPFNIGSDGRVVTTSDPDAQVRLHVLALINTSPIERVMVPGYGIPLTNLMFSDLDNEEVTAQMQTMITSGFQTWEPGVRLDDVVASDDSGGNLAALDVHYSRKDAADSGTTANTNSAIIGANGEVREIVRG